MKNTQSSSSGGSSGILLRGAIYGSIIGSVITAGFSTLSTSALTSADGIFGDYFTRIVTSTCGAMTDGVVTGFKTSPFGEKICQSFQSMLDTNNIYSRSGDIGIGDSTPSLPLDVSGSIMARGATADIDANRNIWAQAFHDRNNGMYYVDPDGTSNMNTISGSTICLGGDCKTAWPGGSGTSGGIVTGPLRWSDSPIVANYFENTVDFCSINLSPKNKWRVPTASEITYAASKDPSLFPASALWWSSTPGATVQGIFYWGRWYSSLQTVRTGGPMMYEGKESGFIHWWECHGKTCYDTGDKMTKDYSHMSFKVRCVSDV